MDDITVLVITYNEEPNIARTLDAVTWARCILVLDSGSTDATVDIARHYPQAEIMSRPFDTFASQCNYGLTQVKTEWVLSLDADYELSLELGREIQALAPGEEVAGYAASFIYRVYGRPLRSTLYPPRTVLYRRAKALYQDHGHGHRVAIDGAIKRLDGKISHDDRKPLARWLSSQVRYARDEAEYLQGKPRQTLRRIDRVRLMGWPAPLMNFFYTLILKKCLLDGWPGWFYVLQRTLAEILLALEIADRRLRTNEQVRVQVPATTRQ